MTRPVDPQVRVFCNAESHEGLLPTLAVYYRLGDTWMWDKARAHGGGSYDRAHRTRYNRHDNPKHVVRGETSDDWICPKCGDRKRAKSANVDAVLEKLFSIGESQISLKSLRASLP